MKKLSHKLFVAIFLSSLVILVSMIFLSKWALERGFINYLNDTENQVLAGLKIDLEELYRVEKSWDSISNNPDAWRELVRKHKRRDSESEPSSQVTHVVSSKKSKAAAYAGGIGRRIRLLDADRVMLIGRKEANENALELVLKFDSNTIGYLSLNPTTEIRDELDLSFTKQLIRTIQFSALGMFVISLLLAIWLAKGFVNPINALVSGTRSLTAGDFSKRIAVNSKDELGLLAQDFNNLAATLESSENSRKQWIADISHELRTPLTILRGEIEAIKDGVHEMSPKMLDSLHTEILQLQNIVKDLYELSLSDVGALSYKKVETDICNVLSEAIEIYQDEIDKNDLTLNFNTNSNVGLKIFADPRRLHQLFSNLISNTLRYTDSGGKLNIDVINLDENVCIDFQDSSPSVSKEDLSKLFERLYRVENSRNRKLGGVGLGLSICKNIVEAHQGQIEATQSSFGGLRIKIILPKISKV